MRLGRLDAFQNSDLYMREHASSSDQWQPWRALRGYVSLGKHQERKHQKVLIRKNAGARSRFKNELRTCELLLDAPIGKLMLVEGANREGVPNPAFPQSPVRGLRRRSGSDHPWSPERKQRQLKKNTSRDVERNSIFRWHA